jgi:hypothetical protein
MNRPIRTVLLVLGLLATALAAVAPAHAQRRDTVSLIQQPGSGPYSCCYTFVVENRQTRPSKIAEFTVRIVSGRASFQAGTAGSPTDWTVFVANDLQSVSWFATSSTSEIDSGVSRSGFTICAADTGIVRFVWETRALDTIYTSDTLVSACRGVDCDETFFRRVPSNEVCLYDVDLVSGNRRGVAINELRLKMLTGGVSFGTGTHRLPTGWTRPRASADSLQFFTLAGALDFDEFVEGLRFDVRNASDTFRVLYQTFSNGEVVCTDTARLVCAALPQIDSVLVRSAAGCCSDLRLSNSHLPGSTLDRFTITVLTPGVRISGTPSAPPRWTRGAIPASGDSVFFTTTTPLASGDTAIFGGVCFDNTAAANDTIRYRWTSYGNGLPISSGTVRQICLRPLTGCDSVRAEIDTAQGAPQRCIGLVVTNRNSADETITRVVARIANPGTARRILTATPPAGWQVGTLTRDSVVFTGGELFADDQARFELCVSAGDTTMGEPLTLTWSTASDRRSLCSGTARITVRVIRFFDLVSVREEPSNNPEYCCYSIAFINNNDRSVALTGFQLEVVNSNVLFGEASGAGAWTVATSGFPAPQFGFAGGTLAPGDSTPRLSFCIDARNISGRPATIPVIWRSFAGSDIVTTERLDLTCVGGTEQACDTAIALTSTPGEVDCSYSFAVVNEHTPSSPIDRIRFRLLAGTGTFTAASASGDAATWTSVSVRPDTVTFTGDVIAVRDSVGSFNVTVGAPVPVTRVFEVCTYTGELLGCCDVVQVECGTTGIAIPTRPSGFTLGEAMPNPLASVTTIPYELLRPASVSLVLRDERGAVVRRIDEGSRPIGRHEIVVDATGLPSGVYSYTLEAGAERWTKRMVVLR